MARPAKTERNKLIKRLIKEGKSYREVAELLGLDHSRVYQIYRGKSTKTSNVEVIHR